MTIMTEWPEDNNDRYLLVFPVSEPHDWGTDHDHDATQSISKNVQEYAS